MGISINTPAKKNQIPQLALISLKRCVCEVHNSVRKVQLSFVSHSDQGNDPGKLHKQRAGNLSSLLPPEAAAIQKYTMSGPHKCHSNILPNSYDTPYLHEFVQSLFIASHAGGTLWQKHLPQIN